MSNRNRDGDGNVHGHQGRNQGLPIRTACHVLHPIRETSEDVTGTSPAPPQKPEQKQQPGPGRPPSMEHPAPIPDSPESIARAPMSGPPTKNWRYLKRHQP